MCLIANWSQQKANLVNLNKGQQTTLKLKYKEGEKQIERMEHKT